jgi:cytochrome c-type biogenesis protein CcmE
MLVKKSRNRLLILFLFLLVLGSFTILIINTLKDNLLYFFTPTEIKNKEDIASNKILRIGGMVKKDSVKSSRSGVEFIITDFKNEIQVTFDGSLPNLFSEEKGVIAQGMLKDKEFFIADKVLAKHDENYMPPEVKAALEEK